MVQYFDTKEASMQVALAFLSITQMLLKAEGQINSFDSESEMKRKAEVFLDLFPEPINLQRNILKRFFSPNGFNIEKHRNFVWDVNLMFNIGNHTIDGSKLYFITSDKAMVDAAKNIKKQIKSIPLTLKEYLVYLNA